MEDLNSEMSKARWKDFYKVAGTMALLIVLVGLVDMITSMLAGEASENSTIGVVEWFKLFQTNRFAALSGLGLINIITLSLDVPVYLALYHVHRRNSPAFAALATILFFIGTAIYISSNTVFSMLALSNQYAVAAEAQMPLLEAAGRAALAQGADLTPGMFMGFFFAQTAGLIMTLVLLQGKVFGKWTAWTGLAGFGLTSIFFVIAAFAPAKFDLAMIFAMFGGLLLMAYHILLTVRFFHLSKKD
ncbi:MAG: hypothetical protein A2X25_07905 [Chloroflexi bacterium GWB2_49_20]|nr:MAG: hypothetical protein A2X25_07905 [Chloroflexi bacterium GWB2_49_20]OGN78075.1 MAG: hypothetical protein A2X26_15710 [Chloroflexi bacterium GWC2_49_37]OGN85113.1 MAG: hypothetical protein A2X27_10410 [Chloroflexi bacterium GWD2_49_16]HBG74846.1 hypothetical protein [Anaerolineae bacterium]HCC78428.1 hypothetical protein [Anaerolineae bacterium]